VHAVIQHHFVFGVVEEVVEDVLLPGLRDFWFEAAEPDGEEVHVQHCDLGPGAEGRL